MKCDVSIFIPSSAKLANEYTEPDATNVVKAILDKFPHLLIQTSSSGLSGRIPSQYTISRPSININFVCDIKEHPKVNAYIYNTLKSFNLTNIIVTYKRIYSYESLTKNVDVD